jgi:hypothetical protein
LDYILFQQPWGETLVVFGGVNAHSLFNDVWYFYIESGSWEKIVNNHTVSPPGRFNHVSSVWGPELIVTLGAVDSNWWDVWSWSFEQATWTRTIKDSHEVNPSVLSGFSYVEDDGYVTLFSGARIIDCENCDLPEWIQPEVWNLDLEYSTWFGQTCYPSFGYDEDLHHCHDIVADDCDDCAACTDLSEIRRSYVEDIEDRLLEKNYVGALIQCPELWRFTVIA